MDMKKIVGVAFILAAMVACGSETKDGTRTPASADGPVSKRNPLVVDSDERTISVYATVNGRYLEESTRHGMNFLEGHIGDKSLFQSHANMLDFHDALQQLGAERGELSEDGHLKGGTAFDITVTWDDASKPYGINEVVEDSAGKSLDFHYGGTRKNALEEFTGCMMCFDSCDVGVTSNATHPKGITEDADADVAIRGREEVLPEDGEAVVVTFALRG